MIMIATAIVNCLPLSLFLEAFLQREATQAPLLIGSCFESLFPLEKGGTPVQISMLIPPLCVL